MMHGKGKSEEHIKESFWYLKNMNSLTPRAGYLHEVEPKLWFCTNSGPEGFSIKWLF